MKIAVFIFGENENINWEFLNQLNCDVYTSVHNINQMYCWKDCLKNLRSTNNIYDIIILSDSNNQITTSTNYQNFLKYNEGLTLYSTGSIYYTGLSDFWVDEDFLMGDFQVISSLIDNLPENFYNISTAIGQTIVELGYYVNVVREVIIKTKKIHI